MPGAPGEPGKPLLVGDFLFEFDVASVREAEFGKVAAIAAYMRANPEVQLSINGHADPRGSNPYNLSLSRRRVESVRAALIGAGVPSGRIRTDAFGEERPVCRESSERCWQLDRRVEVWMGLGRAASR